MELKQIVPYVAIVAAFVVASLTALYTFLGSHSRNARERRQLCCEALFNLLAVWRVLDLSSMKREIEIFVEVMQKRFPEISIPTDGSAARLLQSLLAPTVSTIRQTRTESLKEQFVTAIAKLAAARPILAFEINNRADLLDIIEHINDYENRARSMLSDAEQLAHSAEIDAMMESSRESVLRQADKDLKADILKVARSCGCGVHRQTRSMMTKLELKSDAVTRKLLTDLVNDLPPGPFQPPTSNAP